ncbi:MAG: hypothetical protein GY880_19950 [Planctomycetaceae bacterium]|nr:hypothetical protein [Planctomycetaceae bacterium]
MKLVTQKTVGEIMVAGSRSLGTMRSTEVIAIAAMSCSPLFENPDPRGSKDPNWLASPLSSGSHRHARMSIIGEIWTLLSVGFPRQKRLVITETNGHTSQAMGPPC